MMFPENTKVVFLELSKSKNIHVLWGLVFSYYEISTYHLWRIHEVKKIPLQHFLKVKINYIAFSILYIYKIEIILMHEVYIRSINKLF